MAFADEIVSKLRLSRALTYEEEEELEKIHIVKIHDVTVINNVLIEVANTMDYFNPWEVIGGVTLEIKEEYRQCSVFFLESLMYLIRNFFIPNNLSVNGYLMGVDSFFGSYYCYYVHKNQVILLPEMVSYFENLNFSNDLNENITHIRNHMRQLLENK